MGFTHMSGDGDDGATTNGAESRNDQSRLLRMSNHTVVTRLSSAAVAGAVDGAHNASGERRLVRQCGRHLGQRKSC